ncbi:DMT family transporter [Pseudomonas sp. LFM046]|uniref:EamA family transporter n=1 Tax=Pseudomonas sp. LFM046 TaxID=1608357 RepID=UPI0005CFDE8D
MIVAAMLFALMGIFVKQGAQSFTPIELVFWRTLFGVLMLGIPVCLHSQRFLTPHLKVHLVRGCTGYMALLLIFYAMVHLPLATAITLNYTSPMFLALLSVLWLKERFSGRMAAALALGFVGVALLLRPAMGGDLWFYGLVGLASGAMSGVAYLHVRELGQLGEPEWRVVFYFALLSTVLGAALVTCTGWHALTLHNIGPLVGIGLTATLGQLAMTRAYKVGRKLVAANLSYLTVVFSSLLGALLWGDKLSLDSYVAIVVILCSGFVASRR